MRIWVVNQYAVPATQAGITRHHSLARTLIERGHDVLIIASSFDHMKRMETRLDSNELWRREIVDGVPFIWIRTPPYARNSISRAWNMVVFSRRVASCYKIDNIGKPDIVVGSSPHLLAAHEARRLASRFGVPFVLEVRDLHPQSLVDIHGISPKNPVILAFEHIERSLYRSAGMIITLLPKAIDYIADKGAERSKIVWLPNGVNLSSIPVPSSMAEGGCFTVMYAGSHTFTKGLDIVLDAARLIDSDKDLRGRVKFHLIGDGPDKQRLEERVMAESIPGVCFEDPVPKAEIYATLETADALLLTLRSSPVFRWGISPNKLFDYFAVARPIISAVDTSVDIVSSAKAGIGIPPGNPEAMVSAIRELVNMGVQERREMGLRGRQYVEEHHDNMKLAEQLECYLLRLVDAT